MAASRLPELAAPTASQAIGAEFSAPASASPIERGAPVIEAPAQMASPANTCSNATPTVAAAISLHTKRIRDTSVANTWVHLRALSSATMAASRVVA